MKTGTNARARGIQKVVGTSCRARLSGTIGLIILGLADSHGHQAQAGDLTLKPTQFLQISPDLSVDGKEATNVTGAACADVDGNRMSCLLVGDEVKYARSFSLSDQHLIPGRQLYLLPKRNQTGEKFDETDAEGVAFYKGAYFLAGSHSLNKGSQKQQSRYFIYRVAIDGSTGQVADFGTKDTASSQVEKNANFEKILAADPKLGPHMAQIPDDGGVNIEGIAISGDALCRVSRPLAGWSSRHSLDTASSRLRRPQRWADALPG
ncbi:DUF3616 domain-containing protein [Rhizobium sp. SEMIA 4085]|nr:DUF3616 domain-containing protein [Rhizobium sp. SEMIA 4085]TDW34086.1 uncharacterized protein DUF3616 [Rhizobium azibense]